MNPHRTPLFRAIAASLLLATRRAHRFRPGRRARAARRQ
jgi:hypothetical protein